MTDDRKLPKTVYDIEGFREVRLGNLGENGLCVFMMI